MVKFPRDICPAVGSIIEDLWLTPIRGTSCTESGPPDGRKRHKGCTLNFSHISIPTFRVPNTLLGSRLILRRCLQLYGAYSSQKRICMASHFPRWLHIGACKECSEATSIRLHDSALSLPLRIRSSIFSWKNSRNSFLPTKPSTYERMPPRRRRQVKLL